jgi:hypothetical protein
LIAVRGRRTLKTSTKISSNNSEKRLSDPRHWLEEACQLADHLGTIRAVTAPTGDTGYTWAWQNNAFGDQLKSGGPYPLESYR